MAQALLPGKIRSLIEALLPARRPSPKGGRRLRVARASRLTAPERHRRAFRTVWRRVARKAWPAGVGSLNAPFVGFIAFADCESATSAAQTFIKPFFRLRARSSVGGTSKGFVSRSYTRADHAALFCIPAGISGLCTCRRFAITAGFLCHCFAASLEM